MDKKKILNKFGSRVREARLNKGWSQQELAEQIGTSKSMISGYETGKNDPAQSVVMKLAEKLGVTINWLMGFEDDSLISSKYTNIITMPKLNKKVPLLGTIAAGIPILADENVEMYVELDRTFEADFCLRVRGDSMVNANINDGDIVFIRKQSDVDDGQIAAVLIDEEATLKRVYKIGGVVQLRAENPKFAPITLNGEQNVIILGKATYKLSEIL